MNRAIFQSSWSISCMENSMLQQYCIDKNIIEQRMIIDCTKKESVTY
jgi:hypothetical protein